MSSLRRWRWWREDAPRSSRSSLAVYSVILLGAGFGGGMVAAAVPPVGIAGAVVLCAALYAGLES